MLTRAGSKTGIVTAVALAALGAGCRKQAGLSDQGQIGAAVGEVMASADESANGGSTTAMLPSLPVLRAPAVLRPPLWRRAVDALALIPSAYAASCLPVSYSACTAGVRTATFDNCNVGAITVAGSVNLTFSDAAACNIATVGDSVNRTASLTLSALGGSLAITSPGGGQTLTRTATGFTFAVPGMERVLTLPSGRTLFDIATSTAVNIPLTITGNSRSDMVITGGELIVEHKLANYSVTLVPSNLTWTPTCTCASSGSLTGTVSSSGPDDGKTATVTITGCGTADVTIDGDTESVTLDRCASI
jgi:hypothetical protein